MRAMRADHSIVKSPLVLLLFLLGATTAIFAASRNTLWLADAFVLPVNARCYVQPFNTHACRSFHTSFDTICQQRLYPDRRRVLYMSGSSMQDLEQMTVQQLKQLIKDSNLNERGLMTRLKRKQDLVDFLYENLSDREEEEQQHQDESRSNDTTTMSHPAALDLNGFTESTNSDSNDDYAVPNDLSYQDYVERFEGFLANIDPKKTTVTEVQLRQEHAQAAFDEMYESFVFGSEHLEPQIDIYNLLIRVYGIPIQPRPEMAQLILDRMESSATTTNEKGDASTPSIPSPNIDSYIHVMEAWAHDNKPEMAEEVFERLSQQPYLQVNTEVYNTLLKAWLKSRGDDIEAIKAARAESILDEMLKGYKEGNAAVKPTVKTWERVIKCVASERTDDSTERALELLEELKDMAQDDPTSPAPNTDVYNAVISAVAKNRDASKELQQRGSMAESILYDMMDEYRDGKVEARPNVGSFINVIHAYRGSPDTKAGIKAEKLLELLEGMSAKEQDDAITDLEPNDKIYNAVLDVVGRTRDPTKSLRAQRILNRMVDHNVTPNVRSYNAVLNACAFTWSKDPKQLMDAFRVAVDTMNRLRSSSTTLEPDAVSYGLFLKSCAQLMPPNSKRDAVVETMFLKCCMDGKVSDFVLQSLADATTPQMYRKLTTRNQKRKNG